MPISFSEDYAKETDDGYICPKCNSELLYKACEYCTFSTTGEIEKPTMNTACEECEDIERWLNCPKCKINFDKRWYK